MAAVGTRGRRKASPSPEEGAPSTSDQDPPLPKRGRKAKKAAEQPQLLELSTEEEVRTLRFDQHGCPCNAPARHQATGLTPLTYVPAIEAPIVVGADASDSAMSVLERSANRRKAGRPRASDNAAAEEEAVDPDLDLGRALRDSDDRVTVSGEVVDLLEVGSEM